METVPQSYVNVHAAEVESWPHATGYDRCFVYLIWKGRSEHKLKLLMINGPRTVSFRLTASASHTQPHTFHTKLSSHPDSHFHLFLPNKTSPFVVLFYPDTSFRSRAILTIFVYMTPSM